MSNEEVFAFVLMPFNEEFDDIYKMGIKDTATSLGVKAERVDEQIFQEGILDRIYRQIEAADIVIADMSNQNPNVFYEVGYAHAKEKLCLLLTKNSEDIPFDLTRVRRNRFTGFRHSERARMPAGFCKLDAMSRALLVGFGLAERLSASALHLSYFCGARVGP
jgi:nucleoside 2-deoxyribosyltransferase